LEEIEKEILEYEKQSQDPSLWDNQEYAQMILKKLSALQKKIDSIQDAESSIKLFEEMLEIGEWMDVSEDLERVEQLVKSLRVETVFTGEHDAKNAMVTIQAGAGGVDAQDFAEILTRMYVKFTESRGYDVDMVEYTRGNEAGIKQAIFFVKGEFAYGYLRRERGVHRLVRISPFNAAGQRHTSFAMVQVLPEFDELDGDSVKIVPEDLKIDVFRSSGPGGQSVNTTDSAVRITHIPSGIVVSSQSERSQLQNKDIAFRILRSKLWEKEIEKRQQMQNELSDSVSISWGNSVRSYVLNPYKLVKDTRSGYETTQVESVLEGDLMDVLESVLYTNTSPVLDR
jgi:peptide chain release factor 2